MYSFFISRRKFDKLKIIHKELKDKRLLIRKRIFGGKFCLKGNIYVTLQVEIYRIENT